MNEMNENEKFKNPQMISKFVGENLLSIEVENLRKFSV